MQAVGEVAVRRSALGWLCAEQHSCMYLAHHELESDLNIVIIVINIEQYFCLLQAVGEVAVRRGALKLGQLAADVQALRDVKHFVKDYKGHMLPADHATGEHYCTALDVGWLLIRVVTHQNMMDDFLRNFND